MEILIVSIAFAFLCFVLGMIIGLSNNNEVVKKEKGKNYKVELISYKDDNKYNLDITVSDPVIYDDLDGKQLPVVIYDRKCQIKKII
jgi:hypothetical protein